MIVMFNQFLFVVFGMQFSLGLFYSFFTEILLFHSVVNLPFLYLWNQQIMIRRSDMLWLICCEACLRRSWARKWTAPRFSSQRMAAGERWDLIVTSTLYQTVLRPGLQTILLLPQPQPPIPPPLASCSMFILFNWERFNRSCCCVCLTFHTTLSLSIGWREGHIEHVEVLQVHCWGVWQLVSWFIWCFVFHERL